MARSCTPGGAGLTLLPRAPPRAGSADAPRTRWRTTAGPALRRRACASSKRMLSVSMPSMASTRSPRRTRWRSSSWRMAEMRLTTSRGVSWAAPSSTSPSTAAAMSKGSAAGIPLPLGTRSRVRHTLSSVRGWSSARGRGARSTARSTSAPAARTRDLATSSCVAPIPTALPSMATTTSPRPRRWRSSCAPAPSSGCSASWMITRPSAPRASVRRKRPAPLRLSRRRCMGAVAAAVEARGGRLAEALRCELPWRAGSGSGRSLLVRKGPGLTN
mmetsp:Transcript_10644/g.31596  ORF Transcript_10644/g.31596 Transcript_10644/m.31596 type:complete len:273 (+) Transcript_10644:504-1322(+)